MNVIDITLSTDQIADIFKTVMSVCEKQDSSVKMSTVIQIMVENIKQSLEQKQNSFIASHGTQYFCY